VRLLATAALIATLLAFGSTSHAAQHSQLELGFVRADSIWLASPTGSNAHIVLRKKSPYTYLEPAWSRFGDLAVTQYEETESHGYSDVEIIRPAKRKLFIGTGIFNGRASWAPDGKRLVFVGYNYGEPPGGTLEIRSLAAGSAVSVSKNASSDDIDDEPAWSPDAKTIAFTRPQFDANDDYVTRHLFLIGSNGQGERQLTKTPAFNPSWSPDSRRIVFDNGHNIYVIPAVGGTPRRLTSAGTNSEPSWSPDGNAIAFQRGSAIWIMNTTGSSAHRVLRNAQQPAWKPR
jgi:Tol biopolymer transport system component